MDLEALNNIAGEAKSLDHDRAKCKHVRENAVELMSIKESLVSQLMNHDSFLRRYSDSHKKRLIEYIDEIIEPMRADILAQIEVRMQAEEKLLFMKAAAKRQLITASIVSKPADTDGGAS